MPLVLRKGRTIPAALDENSEVVRGSILAIKSRDVRWAMSFDR